MINRCGRSKIVLHEFRGSKSGIIMELSPLDIPTGGLAIAGDHK